MTTDKTSYSELCSILGDVWLGFKDEPEYEDFIQRHDLGLPLAYSVAAGIVASTPLAEKYIRETWEHWLEALGFEEDLGWDSLDDMLIDAS